MTYLVCLRFGFLRCCFVWITFLCTKDLNVMLYGQGRGVLKYYEQHSSKVKPCIKIRFDVIVKVKFLSLLYFSTTVWKTGLQMKPRTQLLGDWREFLSWKEANSSLHEHQTQTLSQPGETASRKGRAPACWLRLSLNHSLPIVGFLVNCKLQELGLVYHKRSRWDLQHKQLEV